MVFNIESENGYRVSILDKTNSTEAVYWTTDFLGLEQCEDNYFQTSNYLKLCKDFVQEVYNQENDIPKADQIDMLNRSIDYFKKADTFNENLFKEEVVSDPQIIDAFENFKNYYEEKNELALKDQFDVSNSAVKDEKKYFKHVLKLDKNFHVTDKRNTSRKGTTRTGIWIITSYILEKKTNISCLWAKKSGTSLSY